LDRVVLYLQELTADIAAVSGAAAADSDLHTPSLEPTTQTTAYVKVRPTLIFHQFFIAGVTEAVRSIVGAGCSWISMVATHN
jgi:hypothetical protein